jgi:uncharacterized protein (DUF1330 family)
MTAYVVILRERTTDPDELERYREKAPLAREGHAVTPVAFYGEYEVLEGAPFEGAAILSFPSMDEARAWYASPAYQAARVHRQRGSDSRMFIVAGVDEAPPR